VGVDALDFEIFEETERKPKRKCQEFEAKEEESGKETELQLGVGAE